MDHLTAQREMIAFLASLFSRDLNALRWLLRELDGDLYDEMPAPLGMTPRAYATAAVDLLYPRRLLTPDATIWTQLAQDHPGRAHELPRLRALFGDASC